MGRPDFESILIRKLEDIYSAISGINSSLNRKRNFGNSIQEDMEERSKTRREEAHLRKLDDQNLLIKNQNKLLLFTLLITAISTILGLILRIYELSRIN
jgi:hypothetical protein